MYALKTIGKNPEGNLVETSTVLGDWYTLEFTNQDKTANDAEEAVAVSVAKINYAKNNDLVFLDVLLNQDAYVTTLEGTTVRVIRNRGIY